MNRQCSLIFYLMIVLISAEKKKADLSLINGFDGIELSEEPSPIEIFDIADQSIDNTMPLFQNETLKNRNTESMTNPELITKGHIVSAISEVAVNGNRRLDALSLLGGDQYLIGQSRKRGLVVDLARESKLAVTPGTNYLMFLATNYLEEPYDFEIKVESASHLNVEIVPPFPPSFPVIYSRETVQFTVRIVIPPNVVETDHVIDTVTFSVRRRYDSTEVQKSVRLYSRNSLPMGSRTREPTIDYEFYDNCIGKLKPERCMYSRWSVKITVTNNESGLGWKGITSEPNGIWPERDFIAGDKNLPGFIYSASCCHKSVDIKVIDILDYPYSLHIDVTEWSNLGQGEIIAIIIGTLFLLLLLIIVIVLCIRCVRKQKNADLSYTHRYGSRPPA
ncbi:uncharacterized protein [Chelonus insularis]|uniref:uncharacterized protein n=1 Tax=Chelonus insularis TaxID=460826 RepID=UPI00158C4E8C|nr:uncharacterized protein LOC118065752 [Chelonus insularis]